MARYARPRLGTSFPDGLVQPDFAVLFSLGSTAHPRIVEALDVIEDVCSCSINSSVNALSFEHAEELFTQSIVGTAADVARAAGKVMVLQYVSGIICKLSVDNLIIGAYALAEGAWQAAWRPQEDSP